jgi:uncharacterized membrane protein YobD (UPF0266 family)
MIIDCINAVNLIIMLMAMCLLIVVLTNLELLSVFIIHLGSPMLLLLQSYYFIWMLYVQYAV